MKKKLSSILLILGLITTVSTLGLATPPQGLEDESFVISAKERAVTDDYINQYFTIESLDDNNTITLTINQKISSIDLNSVSYSLDGLNWTTLYINATDQTKSFALAYGQKVFFKGVGKRYCHYPFFNSCFSSTGIIKVYGNVMSLLYGDNFSSQSEFPAGSSYTFAYLFQDCAGLVSAENLVLPITPVVNGCYKGMFSGCSSLVAAPVLPATSLSDYCYADMFSGCSSLVATPALPATDLAYYCYDYMFRDCISLVDAPALPATTLAEYCYRGMFSGCSSLVAAPALPATSLSDYCYADMFSGCSSLVATPALPATDLAYYCYDYMFRDCISMVDAPALPATTLAEYCYRGMFSGCSSLVSAPALPATSLADCCYCYMFYDCTSLIEAPDLPAAVLENNCYTEMFNGCISLVEAPALPAIVLAYNCYAGMFFHCSSLVEAPALPATTLARYCYEYMFQGCVSMVEAPALPATVLNDCCYSFMFQDCESLVEAPALPATSLADLCYYSMFRGCSSLVEAPDLPATTLADSCYSHMFFRCSSLAEAPNLPATNLANYCYSHMFFRCTSLVEAPELPAIVLKDCCYRYMFSGCSSLTVAPSLPATTLADHCYYFMFRGCTSLIEGPALVATNLADYCYGSMFRGCTSLVEAPALVATNLADNCYRYMFKDCTSLSEVTCLATDISALDCTFEWLSNVSLIGVFHKSPFMQDWLMNSSSGIPEGWIIDDIHFIIAAMANPSEGGTVSGTGDYNLGGLASLTAIANEGYTFVNWTENGEPVSESATYEFTVVGPRNLVANFSLNSYEVTAVANPSEGGGVAGEGFVDGVGTFDHGTTATLTATANEGYTFVNWTENGEPVSESATYEFTVVGARNLVANFSLNSYEIIVLADPAEGGIVTGSGTYNHGLTATLTAVPNQGYTFANWKKGNTIVSTDPTYAFTVNEAATFTATFVLNSYLVSASANPVEGGSVNGAGHYSYGATATLTATAAAGYSFVNWTENGQPVSESTIYAFEVSGARNLVANFSLNSYEITVVANPEGGGIVTGAGTYVFGLTATLTAAPNMGYTFVNWKKGNTIVSTNPTYVFMVNETATYTATFVLNSYEIIANANPAEGGAVSGAGSYDYGQTCVLTAIASEGYIFQNWTENDEPVSELAMFDFEVTGPRVLVANFIEEVSVMDQAISLSSGWNWWSSCLEMDATLDAALKDAIAAENTTAVIKNVGGNTMLENGTWSPDMALNNESMYMIRVDNAVTATLTAAPADPTNHPITLASGWNWIGFPTVNAMTLDEAFAGITPNEEDVVKGTAGPATYTTQYGWNGSLTGLEPGVGYMYKNNGDPMTLTYPSTSKGVVRVVPMERYWMSDTHRHATTMTMLATLDASRYTMTEGNYEIGAFVGDECRGSARLQRVGSQYIAYLSVSGEEGETVRFKLYDVTNNVEQGLAEEQVSYVSNAITGTTHEPVVLHFRGTTDVNESAYSVSMYPNPTKDEVVIHGHEIETVKVYNALGQLVYMEECDSADNVELHLNGLSAGVYTVNVRMANGQQANKRIVKE